MNTRIRIAVLTMALLVAIGAATPLFERPAAAAGEAGTIAYVRPNDVSGDEVRLIEPDGSGDRLVWSTGQPDQYGVDEITDLDWKPSADALAFASDHESYCSRFASDVYTILADGSNYRRVTNGPTCGALAHYSTGTVTVDVRNYTNQGPFFVYVQGSPELQMVVVPAGGTGRATFTNVADFGDMAQQAVVISGVYRWLAPIAAADVQPGRTVHAGAISITGPGYEGFGAYVPSWRSDGSQIGYVFGQGAAMYTIPATASPSDDASPLVAATGVFPDVLDRGPTPATANQIIYYSYLNDGIFQVAEGSASAGTMLVETRAYELVYDVQWLPDGSGFLFSKQGFDDDYVDNGNIFLYSFASGTATQLTSFVGEFARDVSVSPDGQQIVFERSATKDFTSVDLWIMRRDGGEMRLLVRNGRLPSWSQRAVRAPEKLFFPLAQH